MKKGYVKRVFAGLLSFVFVYSAFMGLAQPIRAVAGGTNIVKYQSVSYEEFSECITKHVVPKCTLTDESSGYLFGGWYRYVDGLVETIESNEGVGENENIVAKFVPARLTGVFCQNKADVEETDVDSTSMRIVSAVDSLNYSEVGFNIYGREKNADGTYDNWLMYGYGTEREAKSTVVYSGLQVYKVTDGVTVEDGDPKTPSDLWGADAESFKFTTFNLTGIPKAAYNTIVVIKPYWITLDGTYVEGIGEFNRVQDGIDDVINISINTKNAKSLAAGILEVEFDKNAFEYIETEAGKVFDEMYFDTNVESGIVKSVGVMNDIANTNNPNDVYINIRFKKTELYTYEAGEAVFDVTVPSGGFSDVNEVLEINTEAWDVRY